MDVLHLWNDDLIYPANLGEIDWMDNVWMIRVTLENWIPVIQDGALFWLLHITFVYNSILLFTSVPNTTKNIFMTAETAATFSPKLLSPRSFYSRKKNNNSKTFQIMFPFTCCKHQISALLSLFFFISFFLFWEM